MSDADDYADRARPRLAAPGHPPCGRLGWAVAASAAGLYAGSLLLPTAAPFNPAFSTTTYPGYQAFGMGKALLEWQPEEIDWWVLGFAWLANPAIWAAIVLTAAGRRRAAGVAAGCGMALGLVALPRYYPIVAGLPGYWFWLGSAGVLLAAGLAQWYWAAAESMVQRFGELPVVREGAGEALLAEIAGAPRALVLLTEPWSGPDRAARAELRKAVARLAEVGPPVEAFALREESELAQRWLGTLGLPEPYGRGVPVGWGSLLWLESGRVVGFVGHGIDERAAGIISRTRPLWGAAEPSGAPDRGGDNK